MTDDPRVPDDGPRTPWRITLTECMSFIDMYPDEQTEEQWRVVWFPPDKPDQIFVGTEAQVRRKMATESVAEWNPIIEKRTVVVSSWEGAQ